MVRMYNIEIYSVLRSQMIWTGWGEVGIRALELLCQPGLFIKTVFQDLISTLWSMVYFITIYFTFICVWICACICMYVYMSVYNICECLCVHVSEWIYATCVKNDFAEDRRQILKSWIWSYRYFMQLNTVLGTELWS